MLFSPNGPLVPVCGSSVAHTGFLIPSCCITLCCAGLTLLPCASLFSSGVTFACESARISGELICEELKGNKQDWETLYAKHLKQGVDTFRTYVKAWYDGRLQTIFFSEKSEEGINRKICSVLAGYVWDKKNAFVRSHDSSVTNLAQLLKAQTNQTT